MPSDLGLISNLISSHQLTAAIDFDEKSSVFDGLRKAQKQRLVAIYVKINETYLAPSRALNLLCELTFRFEFDLMGI